MGDDFIHRFSFWATQREADEVQAWLAFPHRDGLCELEALTDWPGNADTRRRAIWHSKAPRKVGFMRSRDAVDFCSVFAGDLLPEPD